MPSLYTALWTNPISKSVPCPYCGFVTAVRRSFLLTSKGLHIPHLSKLRTNDKWWRDCVGRRSCNSHVGCCKRGGRELCTGEWSLANLPPSHIHNPPLIWAPPPPVISSITTLNPGAVVVLVLWKVSKRQTVERAPRGPGTKWTVADCRWDCLIAPTTRYLNTGKHTAEFCCSEYL